ncbi:hypothetical protein WJX75_003295 [Coccomyxa subellipsoidea]|uniref:Uncharacterized protein n=1 Tax=Coccomyxa subellipsoidea TaxID=248742 RepID=A0ABR2YAU2_9CHLO
MSEKWLRRRRFGDPTVRTPAERLLYDIKALGSTTPSVQADAANTDGFSNRFVLHVAVFMDNRIDFEKMASPVQLPPLDGTDERARYEAVIKATMVGDERRAQLAAAAGDDAGGMEEIEQEDAGDDDGARERPTKRRRKQPLTSKLDFKAMLDGIELPSEAAMAERHDKQTAKIREASTQTDGGLGAMAAPIAEMCLVAASCFWITHKPTSSGYVPVNMKLTFGGMGDEAATAAEGPSDLPAATSGKEVYQQTSNAWKDTQADISRSKTRPPYDTSFLGKLPGMLAVESAGNFIMEHFAQNPGAFLVDAGLPDSPPLPLRIPSAPVRCASLLVNLTTLQRMLLMSATHGPVDMETVRLMAERHSLGHIIAAEAAGDGQPTAIAVGPRKTNLAALTETQKVIRWFLTASGSHEKYHFIAHDQIIKKAWLTGQKRAGFKSAHIDEYWKILENDKLREKANIPYLGKTKRVGNSQQFEKFWPREHDELVKLEADLATMAIDIEEFHPEGAELRARGAHNIHGAGGSRRSALGVRLEQREQRRLSTASTGANRQGGVGGVGGIGDLPQVSEAAQHEAPAQLPPPTSAAGDNSARDQLQARPEDDWHFLDEPPRREAPAPLPPPSSAAGDKNAHGQLKVARASAAGARPAPNWPLQQPAPHQPQPPPPQPPAGPPPVTLAPGQTAAQVPGAAQHEAPLHLPPPCSAAGDNGARGQLQARPEANWDLLDDVPMLNGGLQAAPKEPLAGMMMAAAALSTGAAGDEQTNVQDRDPDSDPLAATREAAAADGDHAAGCNAEHGRVQGRRRAKGNAQAAGAKGNAQDRGAGAIAKKPQTEKQIAGRLKAKATREANEKKKREELTEAALARHAAKHSRADSALE